MSEHLLQQITMRYEYYLHHGDDIAMNTAEFIDLIELSRKYLSTLSDADSASGFDLKSIMHFKFRRAAASIMEQASWLDPIARKTLQSFIEEQPALLGGKYQFSTDWHTYHIPQWKLNLKRLAGAPDLKFLEVGCFEGFSTCWLLANILTHETSEITCIDSRETTEMACFEMFDYNGQKDKCPSGLNRETPSIESRFDYNIEAAGGGHKVKKYVGRSQNILRTLPLLQYDFIYIDGSHFALNVLEDGVLAWRTLKCGGLLTFDDYEWLGSPDPLARPKIAIDAILQVYAHNIELVQKGYQVTVKKIAD